MNFSENVFEKIHCNLYNYFKIRKSQLIQYRENLNESVQH